VKMGMDQHAEHAQGPVGLDEAHAAHVGRKIVNRTTTCDGFLASFFSLKIKHQVLDVIKLLIPFSQGPVINGPNVRMSLPAKISDQVAPNKTAPTTNNNFFRIVHNIFQLYLGQGRPVRSIFKF